VTAVDVRDPAASLAGFGALTLAVALMRRRGLRR
jgi:uncharacterized protein (TIGR03382 family)